jgi:Arm DNA-binding domain/Phage integrase, N-terminal SAM-like domain
MEVKGTPFASHLLPNFKDCSPVKLTKTKLEELELPPGKTDHIEWDDELPGFGVRLRESGAKYFIAQYRIGKKQGRETIGKVASIEIDAARKKARAILELAELGQNPKAVRQDAERKTAQAIPPLIDRFLIANTGGWADKYYKDNERALKVYFRKLHSKALTEVQRSDVADELAVIQKGRGDTTRNRARAALSGFYNWAIAGKACASSTPWRRPTRRPR